MSAWKAVRGVLGVVTLAAIVVGVWQVSVYLGGSRSGYERWLYAPFLLAAVTGILTIGPRRAATHAEGNSPDAAAASPSSLNPWALVWFIALCMVGGAAQFLAFTGTG